MKIANGLLKTFLPVFLALSLHGAAFEFDWPGETAKWMADLPDDVPLGRILMPGSHDAGMVEGYASHAIPAGLGIDGLFINHDLTIGEQLAAGSRWFDLRPELHDGVLLSTHRTDNDLARKYLGGAVGGCGESYSQIFSEAVEFLKANPSETVVFDIGPWCQTDDDDEAARCKAAVLKMMSDFDAANGGGLFFRWTGQGACPSGNALPLGAVRGRIIAILADTAADPANGVFSKAGSPGQSGTFHSTGGYANSDDLATMRADQLAKWARCAADHPDPTRCDYSMSWQLTWQFSLADLGGSNRKLSSLANPHLGAVLKEGVARYGYPYGRINMDYLSAALARKVIAYNFNGFAAEGAAVRAAAPAHGTVASVTADGEAVEADEGIYAVRRGATVVVTYHALSGYVFGNGKAVLTDTLGPVSGFVEAAAPAMAKGTASSTVSVTVSGDGRATGAGTYAVGKKVTLKATASKGSVFGGWYDGAGGLVSQQPSYALVAGAEDVALEARFIPVAEDWARVECPEALELVTKAAIAPVAVALDCGSLPTVKVTGLPSGLKYDKTAGAITGTPAKSGVYAALLTVTTAGKATATRTVKIVVRLPGEHVLDADYDAARGKVTGAGVYAPGKKATLRATASKGYVFCGWYDGDALLSREASLSLAMPSGDARVEARFATVAEDAASIAASVGPFAFDPSQTKAEGICVTCGVSVRWPVAASALSSVTVAASGLPSGLKYDKKANAITGTPTSASKTDSKGAVKPSAVKLTVTTAGKSKLVCEFPVVVEALPAWAVGTFNGAAELDGAGAGTVTVSAAGKVSGKAQVKVGTKTVTTSFSCAGFASFSDGVLVAATTYKAGKTTVSNLVALSAYACGGMELGRIEDLDDAQPIALELLQNPWLRKDVSAPAIPTGTGRTLTCDLVGEFEGVRLTFKAKGVVSASGTRGGKKYSASAQLLLEEGDGRDGKVVLDGQEIPLALDYDASGALIAVSVRPEP